MEDDTTWITDEDALREYIEQGDDNDTVAPEELDRLFALVYGRKPDDKDREEGLWSHICAGIGHD
jgi:hypothetical protein